MERTRELTTFAIDGYQISATFADSRNTTALGHVKQILLSSFANNAAKHTHGAYGGGQRPLVRSRTAAVRSE